MEENIYQKLYAILCGAASDAVDALTPPINPLLARCILTQALQETEDLYIQSTEALPSPDEEHL